MPESRRPAAIVREQRRVRRFPRQSARTEEFLKSATFPDLRALVCPEFLTREATRSNLPAPEFDPTRRSVDRVLQSRDVRKGPWRDRSSYPRHETYPALSGTRRTAGNNPGC